MIRKAIDCACGCLLLLAGLAIPSGCMDDELGKTAPEVVEGVPVTATMTVSASLGSDIVVNTRADNSLSELEDLTLFIFDSQGKFQHTVSTLDKTLTIIERGGTAEGQGTTHQVEFQTTSGNKKILAFGNLFSSYWYVNGSTNMDKLRDANEGKYTFDELEDIIFELSVLTSDPGQRPNFYMPVQMASSGQMMASGRNEGLSINTNGEVTVWGDEGTSQYGGVGIEIQRSMARITFNIPEDPQGGKGEFIPSSYTVYNIPKLSYVVNSHGADKESKLTPQTADQRFIHYSTTNIPSASDKKYTFQFYMPENIYERKDSVTGYHDRDKWGVDTSETPDGVDAMTGATPLKKSWTNAPQTSTFVVIRGTYSGAADTDNNDSTTDGSVTADVSYTIHLGDFSASGSVGDFSVKRNYSYTYNVNVLGVDNIIVEAQVDGDEKQPGAEGTVYDTESVEYSYNLDAHYEQVYLEYNLSTIVETVRTALNTDDISNPTDQQLDDAIANQLVLVIQSEAMDHNKDGVSNKRGSLKPYKLYTDAVRDNGSANVAKEAILAGEGTNGKPTKGYDYKWVEFWPQSTADAISEYPGISSWAREDLTDMKNQDYYEDGGTSTTESERLMDVYDIIVAMGKAVKQIYQSQNSSINTGETDDGIIISRDGNDYVARFTAFVNEYYYLRHPLTGEKSRVWNTFTNKIPRQMIIAVSSDISKDGNSSYSKIYSYISQLSMQTFYNSRVTSLAAFGIETYNETPLTITFGTPQSNSSLSDADGRENQKTLIGFNDYNTPNWSRFINTAGNGWTSSANTTTDHTVHKLTGAYNTGAYAACLSRNRDLNGNGRIDENEIRWYLASLNEYIRIGIGSNAISNAAQLYIGDKMAMDWDSYATKYINQGSIFYTSSSDAHRTYWAVERGAFGPDNSWAGGTDIAKPIRCIRTLPKLDDNTDISSLNGVTADPVYDLIDKDEDANGMLVLKFKDRLADQLYRSRVNGSLDPHTEDDVANSFSEGIFVATGTAGTTGDFQTMSGIIGLNGSMTNPCSEYSEGGYTGWRVPNLLEFMAMERAGLLSTNGMTCCTKFSNQEVRYYFYYSNDNKQITCYGGDVLNGSRVDINADMNRFVRCVRDVPANYFPDPESSN